MEIVLLLPALVLAGLVYLLPQIAIIAVVLVAGFYIWVFVWAKYDELRDRQWAKKREKWKAETADELRKAGATEEEIEGFLKQFVAHEY